MKLTIAIVALLSVSSALRVRDDVGDLFNDNSDEAETLKSIAAAEKVHGAKLADNIS